MSPKAAKSEYKEGCTPRIVKGSGKLTAMERGGESRLTCWLDGKDLRQRLRDSLGGSWTMNRDEDEFLVRKNQRGRRDW